MDIHCKRATELLSDSMQRKLTRYERVCLSLHMLICTACRRVRRQVRLIRSVMRQHASELGRSDSGQLVRIPEDVRRRIAATLNAHGAE
jgi:hypothetical protein